MDAGAAAGLDFSAACNIWSLYVSSEATDRKNERYSRRFRQAQQTTHSTQSSLPTPRVCQTCFSSSVLPVMDILVPPPFSPGFLATLPNYIVSALHVHSKSRDSLLYALGGSGVRRT